ncbi:hypothetical protein L3Q82_007712 [Scortum barcoo]|uniref:Uncharacterized protein n=1 Tax=Scortum barcoo TaxID=214431 RepID=A0ACB8WNT8_9TELE|nr:hypothetical protein L3Q82_007712 [Scortum barcoo]
MKAAADRHRRPAPTYLPGQKVWLSTKDLPLHMHTCKLGPRFVGPFPLSKVITPVSVQLKLPRSLRVHPTFHVSRLKPVKESPLVPPSKPLPQVNRGPVYSFKKLLAVHKRGRGRQFLVDWEGYGPEERSWIPASFIVDHSLIDDFYQHHPEVPGPPGAVLGGVLDSDMVDMWMKSHRVPPATTSQTSRSTQMSAYITKCIDDVTILKTITVWANQKPWLTGEVNKLLKARNAAFRAGDEVGLRTVTWPERQRSSTPGG